MKLSKFKTDQSEEIVQLFEKTFQDSEGAQEGKSIGELVEKLITTTAQHDLFGFCAENDGILLSCIFFSRFTLPNDTTAFMLSPVAVSTDHQRIGIGQKIISFGLEQIKLQGAELVVTYGDPKYYSKIGFEIVSENIIAPPYPLTYPEGWQAQSLVSAPLQSFKGRTQCVQAFRNAAYW